MKLSIIIVNYKNKNLVKYFLINVLAFKLPFDFEAIVVDNDSRDGIKEMMEKNFSEIMFIQSTKNIGMGGGNNLGIKKSSGEYILVANPDITLNETALITLVEFADKNKKAGVVAPKMLNPDKTRQETCYRFPDFFTFVYRRTLLGRISKGVDKMNRFVYGDIDLSSALQVDWVLGGCFLARRKALEEIGLFDQRFFLFLEDTDLCRRMELANWEVWYIPEISIVHLPHRLSETNKKYKYFFSKMVWVHFYSWVKYFWKWRRRLTGGIIKN